MSAGKEGTERTQGETETRDPVTPRSQERGSRALGKGKRQERGCLVEVEPRRRKRGKREAAWKLPLSTTESGRLTHSISQLPLQLGVTIQHALKCHKFLRKAYFPQ